MKHITPLLLLLFLLSCGKKELTLDDFKNYKLKVETKKHETAEFGYSILIPSSYGAIGHDNEDGTYLESFADTNMAVIESDTNFCILQVIKFKYDAPNLQATYDSIVPNFTKRTDLKGLKLIDSGKTDFLQYESYVLHYKSDSGTPGEIEGYSFLLEAKEDSMYYSLDISVPQYKETLKDNMGMLLTCVKSFEMK